MSKIIKYNEFEISESNRDNLKIVLSSLKDASDEDLAKVSDLLSRKLTWGNIKDIADIINVEIEKS